MFWDARCGIAMRHPPEIFGFELFFILKATSIELFQGAMTGDTPLGAGMALNICF